MHSTVTAEDKFLSVCGYADGKTRAVVLSPARQIDLTNCFYLSADEAIDLACAILREATEIRTWQKVEAQYRASLTADKG